MQSATASTASSIKRHNLHSVTNYTYTNNKVTKQELAQKLDLSLPTITKNLQILMDEGYLIKGVAQNSTGGRKAQTYSFRAAAKCAIGADVQPTHMMVCAIDLKGNVIAQHRVSMKFANSQSQSDHRMKAIRKFIVEMEKNNSEVLGVAFAIHGFIAPDSTHIAFGTLVNQSDVEPGAMDSMVDKPTMLVHDAYASAEADLWKDPSIKNAICLYLGKRLGGTVVLDGETRYGTNMRNGAVEHMTIVPGGRKCYCGKEGCANPYCSTDFLLEDEETGKVTEKLGHFFKRLRSGDEQAQERFDQWLGYLALTISNASYLLSGDVIIGGDAAEYLTDDDLLHLKELVDARDVLNTGTFVVRKGACEPNQDIIGAALHFIKPFVADICGR